MNIRSYLPALLVVVVTLLSATLEEAAAQAAEAPQRSAMLESGRKAPVNNVTWKPVLELDFDDSASLEAHTIAAGEWAVRDGQLHAVSGDSNRTILLGKVTGDRLRFEFDATSHANADGTIGDITVLINAVPGQAATAAGYALTTGSYYNTCTTFYRQGRKLARTEYSPIVSGKRNRVVVEFDRGHIRFWMNDEIILEAWDTQPVAIDGEQFIGLRTYNTHLVIDNYVVSQGEAARRK